MKPDVSGYMGPFSCILCDSEHFQRLYLVPGAYSREIYQIVVCSSCGMIQVHPRPPLRYLKSFYDQHFDVDLGSSAPYRMSGFKEALTMLRERFAEPGFLLDVGCGNGSFLEIAKKSSWNVSGVDTSASCCKICRDKGINVYCSELREANFPDSHFDAVTIFHVLEHVLAPRHLLVEAKRILRIGGLLMVKVPNSDSKISKVTGPYWGLMNPPFHLNYFSPMTLSKMLENAGFRVDLVTARFSPEYHMNFLTELVFSVYLRLIKKTKYKTRSKDSISRKALPWLVWPPVKQVLSTPTFLDHDTEIVAFAYK